MSQPGERPGGREGLVRRFMVTAAPIVTTPSRWLAPFIIGVDIAAVALAIAAASSFPRGTWPVLLLFIGLAVLAESWRVPFTGSGEVSLCFIVDFAAATLYGPSFGVLVAGCSSLLIDTLMRRKSAPKIAFNAGQLALSGGLSGVVFALFASQTPDSLATNAVAYFTAAAVFIGVNSALASTVISMLGQRFLDVWILSLREAGLYYLAMAPLGALVANAYLQSPWTLLYFPLLIWVICRGFGLHAKLKTETANALIALADALDRRDPYTFQHSLRVAAYAERIAAELGLSLEESELVVTAAQIHDLGKISIDNRILFKEGMLTADERRQVNTHSAAGADLAAQFSMYADGSLIIRHHHERWDGTGYPDGLSGEAIPFGARIIAVADVYDAMTSDRPYRKALPHDIAIDELIKGRDTQFDARVVDAFLAASIGAVHAPVPTPDAVTSPLS